MDCLHAAEILSATLDGDDVSPVLVARAREHCASCHECAALRVTMERVATIPVAQAPEPLITRILEAVQKEEAARIDAEAATVADASMADVVQLPKSAQPRRRVAPAWWQPHFTPLVSAAAVVLVVSAVSISVLMQMTNPASQPMTADSFDNVARDGGAGAELAQDDAVATPQAGATTEQSRTSSADNAPPYVAWSGAVWVRADGPAPQEATLSPIGVTATDLGDPSGTADREVLTSPTATDAIFVRTQSGGLIRFVQVTRTLGKRTYALATGTTLSTFGTWPTLPQRFSTPTAADGSPVFTAQGVDDRGRKVFATEGADTTNGFALAPGTPASDPAAGNPNWTWWEPVD